MTETAEVYMNWGRWLARCPRCGLPTRVEPEQETFLCFGCFPGGLATAIRIDPDGLGRPVADPITRRESYEQASRSDQIHRLAWPGTWQEIAEALRPRPVHAMNWEPGVTIATLLADNAEMGVSSTRPRN